MPSNKDPVLTSIGYGHGSAYLRISVVVDLFDFGKMGYDADAEAIQLQEVR